MQITVGPPALGTEDRCEEAQMDPFAIKRFPIACGTSCAFVSPPPQDLFVQHQQRLRGMRRGLKYRRASSCGRWRWMTKKWTLCTQAFPSSLSIHEWKISKDFHDGIYHQTSLLKRDREDYAWTTQLDMHAVCWRFTLDPSSSRSGCPQNPLWLNLILCFSNHHFDHNWHLGDDNHTRYSKSPGLICCMCPAISARHD